MSEKNDKPIGKYEWDESYMDMAKYGAMNGHSPTYIAQMAGLKGELRRQFLLDICNKNTKLGNAFFYGRTLATQDVETTIHFLQLQGDTDAMDIAIKQKRLEYISRIKEELFGL